ncbi:MAG: hypothetical protein CMJ43_11430 [Phyllobacteriaceae bacterium]|nr:hypothetical protein [Phyllobacteriaceae bacterium]
MLAVKGMRDGVLARIVAARSRAPAPQDDSNDGQDSGGKPEKPAACQPTGKTRQADRAGGDEDHPATAYDVGDKHPGNAISV